MPATGNATLPPLFNETAPPLALTPAALSVVFEPTQSEWGALPARLCPKRACSGVSARPPTWKKRPFFASGDHVGAEAGLREVLAQSARGECPNSTKSG